MSKVLYISYDGMLEPLGQSQVLGYLEPLAKEHGHSITLISFEKPEDRSDRAAMDAMHKRLKLAGIHWRPLPYHKSPSAPATAFDIAVGTLVALWVTLSRRIEILHARSYVPALMALSVKRLIGWATGTKLLFDMRGFWADERVDGGLWPRDGRNYSVAKRLEKSFLKGADHVVTLTHASVTVMQDFAYLRIDAPPMTVIPTCADLVRFSPASAPGGNLISGAPLTFGYVGSVGTWYLFDETLKFFNALLARRPEARLLVVNRREHDIIRDAVARAGIPEDRLTLVAAAHSEVPNYVRQMDVGGAVIKPCFSKLSSAPTKLAEYLGCGVPCLGNTGVGDMEEILDGGQVGVALRDFSPADLNATADRLLALLDDPDLPKRCVALAQDRFSLRGGVAAYAEIYAELAGRRSKPVIKEPT